MSLPPDFEDYYAMLGVSSTVDTVTLTSAWILAAVMYHPDHFRERANHYPHLPRAQQRYRDLALAYNILITPTLRASYDALYATRPDLSSDDSIKAELAKTYMDDLASDPSFALYFPDMWPHYMKITTRTAERLAHWFTSFIEGSGENAVAPMSWDEPWLIGRVTSGAKLVDGTARDVLNTILRLKAAEAEKQGNLEVDPPLAIIRAKLRANSLPRHWDIPVRARLITPAMRRVHHESKVLQLLFPGPYGDLSQPDFDPPVDIFRPICMPSRVPEYLLPRIKVEGEAKQTPSQRPILFNLLALLGRGKAGNSTSTKSCLALPTAASDEQAASNEKVEWSKVVTENPGPSLPIDHQRRQAVVNATAVPASSLDSLAGNPRSGNTVVNHRSSPARKPNVLPAAEPLPPVVTKLEPETLICTSCGDPVEESSPPVETVRSPVPDDQVQLLTELPVRSDSLARVEPEPIPPTTVFVKSPGKLRRRTPSKKDMPLRIKVREETEVTAEPALRSTASYSKPRGPAKSYIAPKSPSTLNNLAVSPVSPDRLVPSSPSKGTRRFLFGKSAPPPPTPKLVISDPKSVDFQVSARTMQMIATASELKQAPSVVSQAKTDEPPVEVPAPKLPPVAYSELGQPAPAFINDFARQWATGTPRAKAPAFRLVTKDNLPNGSYSRGWGVYFRDEVVWEAWNGPDRQKKYLVSRATDEQIQVAVAAALFSEAQSPQTTPWTSQLTGFFSRKTSNIPQDDHVSIEWTRGEWSIRMLASHIQSGWEDNESDFESGSDDTESLPNRDSWVLSTAEIPLVAAEKVEDPATEAADSYKEKGWMDKVKAWLRGDAEGPGKLSSLPYNASVTSFFATPMRRRHMRTNSEPPTEKPRGSTDMPAVSATPRPFRPSPLGTWSATPPPAPGPTPATPIVIPPTPSPPRKRLFSRPFSPESSPTIHYPQVDLTGFRPASGHPQARVSPIPRSPNRYAFVLGTSVIPLTGPSLHPPENKVMAPERISLEEARARKSGASPMLETFATPQPPPSPKTTKSQRRASTSEASSSPPRDPSVKLQRTPSAPTGSTSNRVSWQSSTFGPITREPRAVTGSAPAVPDISTSSASSSSPSPFFISAIEQLPSSSITRSTVPSPLKRPSRVQTRATAFEGAEVLTVVQEPIPTERGRPSPRSESGVSATTIQSYHSAASFISSVISDTGEATIEQATVFRRADASFRHLGRSADD